VAAIPKDSSRRNPTAVKMQLSPPPKLDDKKLPFVEWYPRIVQRARALEGYEDMIDDLSSDGQYPHLWSVQNMVK